MAFHSQTFTAPELNYDTHDKELLAIFEAFGVWRHYLEGSGIPIDILTDHKNLEYFSTTKPDSLTRQWDVYPKGGNVSVNPSNLRPMFTQEQISTSLRATQLLEPVLRASVIMDQEQLNTDILSELPNDPIYIAHKKET